MTCINILLENGNKGVELNIGSVAACQRPQTRTSSLIVNSRPEPDIH